MSFTIPNEADAFHADQAEPDKVDIDILVAGLAGNGVVSGCAVTAQGTPDMTVAVAAGVIRNADGTTATVASGNVTVGTADATNPRIDLITVGNTGTKACTAGTAAANPVFPAIPASSVVLAAVYVPANDTTIATNQITDKRVVLAAGSIRLTAFLAADETGKTDATLVNTGLSFAVTSGIYYRFRFDAVWTTTVVTVGLKLGLTRPTATIYAATARIGGVSAGTGGEFQGLLSASGDSLTSTSSQSTGVDYFGSIDGVILPSANGTLMLQYAAETTGATVTLRQGSCGELVALG